VLQATIELRGYLIPVAILMGNRYVMLVYTNDILLRILSKVTCTIEIFCPKCSQLLIFSV
jgi:hypothetical protein